MKYSAILFDLDGTLFPISNDNFEKVYLHSLAAKMAEYVEPKHLLKSMWESLDVMIRDTSEAMNDEIFYQAFGDRVGHDLVETMKPKFDDYYLNEFNELKNHLDDNEDMVEAIRLLKERGYTLIIATNPMFPPVAVNQRILFSGLNPEDFTYVSDFEKHASAKPNKEFYVEVCKKNDLDPTKCLMVGNDMYEDMIAKELGMDAWLITDYLIESEMGDLSDWKGTRKEFLERVKEELI